MQYGYDDDGNVLYRQDNVNSAMSELYGYDNLGQLTSFERGTLNDGDTAISGTPSVDETWTYDPLGNRTTNTVGLTTTTETANLQNEITSVSGATTPTYDANGNMTTDQTGLKYVYDAWNRLGHGEELRWDDAGNLQLRRSGRPDDEHRRRHDDQLLLLESADRCLRSNRAGITLTRYVWSPST